jgi:hypothetical protein
MFQGFFVPAQRGEQVSGLKYSDTFVRVRAGTGIFFSAKTTGNKLPPYFVLAGNQQQKTGERT